MKMLPVLLLLLLVPALAFGATAKKTVKPCTRCAHPCTTTATRTEAGSYDMLGALIDGFSITSGFRWDRACPEVDEHGVPVSGTGTHNEDPFFVGADLRVPLNSWASLGGNVDRDFVEAPHWSARVFVALHPWRK